MKIVHIVPGFGGAFYCGNCLRDTALDTSLRREGHEVLIIPIYLPLVMNGDTNNREIPVFYGAVSIYLKQTIPLFRKMPAGIEKLLNSRPVIRLAAHRAGSTRAHGLEKMTESMLLGSNGIQYKELEQLVKFLKQEKPDIVHLSNALLLGLTDRIKEELNVPVVFSLQDEDIWVEAMEEPYRSEIWKLMAEKAGNADAFIAVSRYYAGVIQKKLGITGDKLHVVYTGINPVNYKATPILSKPPAIGYLSRIQEENGFGILVDAFITLKNQAEFRNLRFHFAGGMTRDDHTFYNRQVKKLKKHKLLHQVFQYPHFHSPELTNFFSGITVLSVPVVKGEAFGLYLIEAMASGIPVVQPSLGAFPEIISATGGGKLYSPNTSSALASTLSEVLNDRNRLEEMSREGKISVRDRFNSLKRTRELTRIYESICHK